MAPGNRLRRRAVSRRSAATEMSVPRRGLIAFVLVVLFVFGISAPNTHAQTIGPATHVEFDVTHRELVAGTEVLTTDVDFGQDAGVSILATGNASGTYGIEDLTLEAVVGATDIGTVRLTTEAEHAFTLSGINTTTDVWLEADSRMLTRAQLIDELTLSGVPGTTATVELYFQIRGMADAVINFGPGFGDLTYTMTTPIRLEAKTTLPHSGGGLHSTSIAFPGGYLASNLAEEKFLDEYVVFTLTVDPTEPIPLDLSFEIEPMTNLMNGVEIKSLSNTGLHRPSFWDNAAELLGVVVKDSFGAPIGGVTITSASGYEYPADTTAPPRHPPANTILSPVAIVASDLGEVSPSQSPFVNMINQSGLDVPFTSGQTGFDLYFSNSNAHGADANFAGNWQSDVSFVLPLQGFVDFDLGSTQVIDRMALWNLSLEDIRVLVSDLPTGPFTEVGQYTLPSHLNFFSYNVDILPFNAPISARYVRIQVDSAYLIDPAFTYAIVGEVAVSAIPVPEPGRLMMACWGMGGVLLLAGVRRRVEFARRFKDEGRSPVRTDPGSPSIRRGRDRGPV